MARESSLVLVERGCCSTFQLFGRADGDIDETAGELFCFVRLGGVDFGEIAGGVEEGHCDTKWLEKK